MTSSFSASREEEEDDMSEVTCFRSKTKWALALRVSQGLPQPLGRTRTVQRAFEVSCVLGTAPTVTSRVSQGK